MSLDKLVDSSQLDTDLTSVANAIRTKGGTSAQLAFPAGFVSAIQAIPTGGGGGSEVLLASGTYTESSTVNSMQIPVSCTGKATKVLVVKHTAPTQNETCKWAREYNLPAEMENAVSFLTELASYVKNTGKYSYMTTSITNGRDVGILLDAVTNPTKITVYGYNSTYQIYSGTFDWFIWGEATS